MPRHLQWWTVEVENNLFCSSLDSFIGQLLKTFVDLGIWSWFAGLIFEESESV